jgi:hypothetical protein
MIRISIARLACVVVALVPLPLASSFGPARPAPALAAAPAAKPAAASAPGAADCAVERETFSKLPPEVALQVQDALAYFGLYGNRIDKIVGIDTRAGLAAYCRQHGMHLDNTPASHQALVDELLRDAFTTAGAGSSPARGSTPGLAGSATTTTSPRSSSRGHRPRSPRSSTATSSTSPTGPGRPPPWSRTTKAFPIRCRQPT